MKYLKLFESFEDIDSICKKYGIKDYTINDDDSIDVNGNVYLAGHRLTKLPLRFRNINKLSKTDGHYNFRNFPGYFDCDGNKITSLDGSPTHIDHYFTCRNNKLTSMIGGPKSVGGYYNIIGNKIRTFEGFPRHLGGDFICNGNPVFEFWVLFSNKDKVELFNDFGITDGEVVILDRLNEFLEMIGKPIAKKMNILDIKNAGYKII